MFETEIARGIALLDIQRPGWEPQIDIDHLDLYRVFYIPEDTSPEYNCGCVLAQTGRAFGFGVIEDSTGEPNFGSFRVESQHLLGQGCTFSTLALYGFTLDNDAVKKDYEVLTAEWKAAILALRAERVREAVPC